MGFHLGAEAKIKRNMVADGYIDIRCMITLFGPEKILSTSEDSENTDDMSIHHCQKHLGEHLGKVFSDKEFTDIKIQCEGQSFDCHIAILAGRSPVFKAMFQSNMKEKETQKVAIDDFTPNVVAEMLNFIYMGTVSSHEDLLLFLRYRRNSNRSSPSCG